MTDSTAPAKATFTQLTLWDQFSPRKTNDQLRADLHRPRLTAFTPHPVIEKPAQPPIINQMMAAKGETQTELAARLLAERQASIAEPYAFFQGGGAASDRLHDSMTQLQHRKLVDSTRQLAVRLKLSAAETRQLFGYAPTTDSPSQRRAFATLIGLDERTPLEKTRDGLKTTWRTLTEPKESYDLADPNFGAQLIDIRNPGMRLPDTTALTPLTVNRLIALNAVQQQMDTLDARRSQPHDWARILREETTVMPFGASVSLARILENGLDPAKEYRSPERPLDRLLKPLTDTEATPSISMMIPAISSLVQPPVPACSRPHEVFHCASADPEKSVLAQAATELTAKIIALPRRLAQAAFG